MCECEINRNGEWEVIGIAEALTLRGERLRCLACHGRVLPNNDYGVGASPHFSHLVSFAYCSPRAGDTSPLHPQALP